MLSDSSRNVPLPWPVLWGPERSNRTLALALAIFGAMSAGFVFMALGSYRAGDSTGFAFAIVGSLVGLTAVVLGLPYLRVRRKETPDRVAHVGGALLVNFPAHRYIGMGVFFLLVTVLLGFPLVASVAGLVGDEGGVSASAGVRCTVFALAFPGALSMALYAFWLVRRRNRLVVRESGIEVHHASTVRMLRWDDVRELSPFIGAGGPAIHLYPGRIDALEVQSIDGKPKKHRGIGYLEIHPPALSVDPLLLYHLVCFYLNSPGERHELSTSASVDRSRRGDLLL